MLDGANAYLSGCSTAALSAAVKRYSVVAEVEAIEALGQTRSAAISIAACRRGVSPSAIWRWLRRVDGCGSDPAIRLRHLTADKGRAHAR